MHFNFQEIFIINSVKVTRSNHNVIGSPLVSKPTATL